MNYMTFYPQLREVELPENPDRDEAEIAKLDAIHQPSEKEYLNAILETLPRRFHEIDRALFIIVVELALVIGLICYQLFIR
jgi:hypothetical protein